jgi:hypothetical protein
VLNDTVLLQAIGRSMLTMHTLSHAVLRKLPRYELTSTVGVERPQLQARLAFRLRLDLLNSSRCMILGGDCSYPHVPTEVLVTPRCRRCDWTA